MHDTALRIGCLALEIYSAGKQSRILEVGSYDVNGSLRSSAPAGATYIGIDLEPGPGVDLVVDQGMPLPVEDDSFDLVIASSVLEHDPAFWMTFIEMARKVRSGGYLYINVPSNGAVHRYPEDHWRFYPDSGLALVRWAQSQGQKLHLVESFLADRENDIWNDFVAVFRKGKGKKRAPSRLLHQLVPSSNIRVLGSDGIIAERAETQDMAIISSAQAETRQIRQELAEKRITLAETTGALEQTRQVAAERETLVTEARTEADRIRLDLSEAQAAQARAASELDALSQLADERLSALTETRHRLAELESALIQRQEQVAQTEAALEEARRLVEALEGRLQDMEASETRLREKLSEADAWVFQLAGERRAAERDAAAARREAADAASRLDRLELAAARSAEAAELAGHQLAGARKAHAETLDAIKADHTQALTRVQAEAERVRELHHLAEQARLESEQARLQAEQARFESEQARKQGEQALAERFNETAVLTRLLLEREEANDRELAAREWLREIHAELASRPRWWALMPGPWQHRRFQRRLLDRGLFDARGYLELYPDVAAARMEPLRHFILHGMNEGRRLTR
jgi:SAM-dependent methyltransferase